MGWESRTPAASTIPPFGSEDLMNHATRAPLSTLTLAFALTLGCTPKDEGGDKGDAKADDAKAKADDGGTKDAKADTKEGGDGGDKPGIADTVRDVVSDRIPSGSSDGNLPDRGVSLGWVIARNVEGTMGSLKTQVLPAKYGMYGDLATLKGMATMLGEPGKLVGKIDFAKPMGCALIEDESTRFPLACFIDYEGGAAAVSTDVNEGKQDDAKGHIAHYVVDGQDIYLDDLGTTVIATTHADLFAKAKPYLSDTLLPYATKQRDDLSMVVFPAAAMKHYDAEIAPLMAMAGPDAAAGMEYYKEVDSFVYAFGLEPDGAHLRMDIAATPGTDYAKLIGDMFASGDMEAKWLETQPADTWALTAWRAHMSKMRDSTMMDGVYDMVLGEMAREMGKDATTMKAAITAFLDETEELYGANASLAVMHESGTTGAVVMQLEKAADGREKWKTWSEGFTVEAVAGPDAAKDVEWEFKAGAATVDGVEADRWTIKVKKIADPDMKKLAARFGGKLELTIDRFELDDRVVFVAALSDIDKADAAALAAAKGTKGLADAPNGKTIIDKGAQSPMIMALDAKGMFAWLDQIAPEGKPYPAVGNDLTDAMALTSMEGTTYEVDMVLSQPVIDQLKGLIP